MTGAVTTPKQTDLKKDLTCMIDCVKVQPHLFIPYLATIWAFLDLFEPFQSCFWSWAQVQNLFEDLHV